MTTPANCPATSSTRLCAHERSQGCASDSEARGGAPDEAASKEWSSLLQTLEDAPELAEADAADPLRPEEFLPLAELSEDETQSHEDNPRRDAFYFSPSLLAPPDHDDSDSVSDNVPAESASFALEPFETDYNDESSDALSDFVTLEALPDLDQDDRQAEAELDIGSVSLPESIQLTKEEPRFRLVMSSRGSFSALCAAPRGVVVAEDLSENQSRLSLVAPLSESPLTPLSPDPPGRVLSLARLSDQLLVVSHRSDCHRALFETATFRNWTRLPMPPALVAAGVGARRLHAKGDEPLVEGTDGQLHKINQAFEVQLDSDKNVAATGLQPQSVGRWQASLSATGVSLSIDGNTEPPMPLDSTIGLSLGELDGRVTLWLLTDDFSADRIRLVEIDVLTREAIFVGEIPGPNGSDDLVVQEMLWDAPSRSLYVATSAGLFVLERLADQLS